MTILEFKNYFKSEISDLYTESEATELFHIFTVPQTGFDKILLRRFYYQEMLTADVEELKKIIQQLKTGKPYQYILGNAEFYGRTFFVNENVLIPRPETEELLEFAISKIKNSEFYKTKFRILDIGTGSGVIPILLKLKFPNAEVTSMDIDKKTIEVAKENAEHHQVDIRFLEMDYLQAELKDEYDVIISNPPYIGKEEITEIQNSVKGFEPNIALFSPTSDALIFYRKIAKDAIHCLSNNGMVFLEINQKLGKETLALFNEFKENELIKDLSKNDRIVYAKK